MNLGNPNRNLRFSIGQKTMADSSVNSPRRMLSLSKERASVLLLDPDEKASASSVFEEHGPKPSEVYGFVGSISAVVATAIFLAWAYIPENWLHFVGVTYYPGRYWALAVPAYVMVTVFLAMVFYLGLNFMVTPPPTSLNTMFDEYSRESPMSVASSEGIEHPIEPISDVPIIQINDLMFGRCSKSWKKLKKKDSKKPALLCCIPILLPLGYMGGGNFPTIHKISKHSWTEESEMLLGD